MNRRTFLASTALKAIGTALPFTLTARSRMKETSSIINAGIAGNNTQDLLDRLDRDCLAHSPELTILMAGTNDGLNHAKYIPADIYKENMTQLVQRISDNGSKVLLMTLLPFYSPYVLTRHPAAFFATEGPDDKRAAINSIIKEIADTMQTGLLDMGGLFEKIGNIGTEASCLLLNEANSRRKDGVHPTTDGYRVMALAIYDHIIYNNLPAGRIVCFGDSITWGDGSLDNASYPAYLKRLIQG
jgi:lysophospholipase L1-like esterase